MGLILDSTVVIAAERREAPVEDLLDQIRTVTGPMEIALSVVSVMELERGSRDLCLSGLACYDYGTGWSASAYISNQIHPMMKRISCSEN